MYCNKHKAWFVSCLHGAPVSCKVVAIGVVGGPLRCYVEFDLLFEFSLGSVHSDGCQKCPPFRGLSISEIIVLSRFACADHFGFVCDTPVSGMLHSAAPV